MINFSTLGTVQIFNRVIDDIYDHCKQKLKTQFDKQAILTQVPQLVNNHLNFVRSVKTLWQIDRAVDIDDFYCDSHLIPPSHQTDNGDRLIVKSTSDFSGSNNIVIKGIAGQGKSMFLRHLCVREFEAGKRIPIFIELRKLQKNDTLFDHISKYFDILDLRIDQDLFKRIAKSGNFIFFLDAFDELDNEISNKILNEVEYWASLFDSCLFIITTRPNTSIEMSASFDIWTLDDLRGDEYKYVIRKLADSEMANSIIEKISASSSVSELLCTPLLVTLLLITYKSYQKIPEHLSEFYESIFTVFLQRHDGTKPGFARHRSCKINDTQYRDLFDILCYRTKKLQKSSYTHQDLYKSVNESLSSLKIQEDPDKYLIDIVNITCLIVNEGDEYRFIHRSVQDYYSSTFIKSRPDNVVRPFYTACIDLNNWRHWRYELDFLSSIDKYRYQKYFIIPLCHDWFGIASDDVLSTAYPNITKERAKYIVGDWRIYFNFDADQKKYRIEMMGSSSRPTQLLLRCVFR